MNKIQERMINKYGEEEGNIRYKSWLSKQGHNLQFFINKYGDEIGTKKYNEANKKRSKHASKSGLIELYGEEEGNIRYNRKIEKFKKTLSLEGHIEKYGEIEGREKWENFLKSRSNTEARFIKLYGEKSGKEKWVDFCKSRGVSLEKMIKLYGEEDGTSRYKDWIRSSRPNIENYTRKYGELAAVKLKERGNRISISNQLSGYISRYGENLAIKEWEKTKNRKKASKSKTRFKELYGENWEERYNRYKENMRFRSSSAWYIKRHGEAAGKDMWKNLTLKKIKNSPKAFSKISQTLFFELLNHIEDKESVFFYKHNGEKRIHTYSVDFLYHTNVIEFYGDAYHANPEIFSEGDFPNPFLKTTPSRQIWEKDEKRCKKIEKSGYNILVIWEKDFIKNANGCVDLCLRFLNLHEKLKGTTTNEKNI